MPSHRKVLLCQACGLIQRASVVSQDELRKIYEARLSVEKSSEEVERYVREFLTGENGGMERIKWEHQWMRSHMQEPVKARSQFRVLDVGTREGGMIKLWADDGFAIEGIEPTKVLAGTLSQLCGMRVQAGMYGADSYPSDSFDFIIASQVLHRYDAPVEFFNAVSKHLRPGGFLFVTTPNAADLPLNTLTEQHRIYFTRQTLEFTLEGFGYEWIALDRVATAPQWMAVLVRKRAMQRDTAVSGKQPAVDPCEARRWLRAADLQRRSVGGWFLRAVRDRIRLSCPILVF